MKLFSILAVGTLAGKNAQRKRLQKEKVQQRRQRKNYSVFLRMPKNH